MPPIRTVPTGKPIKTERTHEENQERAYIAASRRSDRSLEARIESARRASEIHKKRTGRALRVTEEDVVNEEMYEEEDEDLPAQYRRLTAHLQTGSLDFNRRFHAYILSQHGTRSALANFDPTITNNALQYPNAPYFANPLMNAFSPQLASSPVTPLSPQSYRHAPYPLNPTQNGQSQSHQRSSSIATPRELQTPQSASTVSNDKTSVTLEEHRRMSLPVGGAASSNSVTPNALSRPNTSRSSSANEVVQNAPLQVAARQDIIAPATNPSDTNTQMVNDLFLSQQSPSIPDNKEQNFSFRPFTTSLPAESQMFLGPVLDPMDPRTSLLMAGSHAFPSPPSGYSSNPSPSRSKTSFSAPVGMNQTLAPAVPALGTSAEANQAMGFQTFSTTGIDSFSLTSPGSGFNLDDISIDPAKNTMISGNSYQGSEPGADDFESLLNINLFE